MKLSVLCGLALSLLTMSVSVRAMDCQALMSGLPAGVSVQAERHLADDKVQSPYCLVEGSLPQRLGVDGKYYQLKFEMRLPRFWKGRLAYQFNGGSDGVVLPALGQIAGQDVSQAAVNRGFAVISSNGGHDADANAAWGLISGALFGLDPQARRDYGYDAVRKLYPIARLITERYYQSSIQYSYGIGASNGGRMAMVSASRFPNFFDGLLVGYPGFNLPKATVQHAWDIQTLHQVNSDIRLALTKRDLELFSREILQQCDGLDGAKDDLIFASEACQAAFKPTSLICQGKYDRECLPREKVNAIMRMFKGPHNSQGKALYSDWVYDAGIRSNNWRTWKVESAVAAWGYKPIIDVMGASSSALVFTTPPELVEGSPDALEDFLLNYDFDTDAPKIFATNNRFPESAMTVMTPPDVMNPKLTTFRQNGGKMIIFHGNSDPVFSVKDTIRWYKNLNFNLEGKANQFVRLYRVPGMSHGTGGPSLDRFDMLAPLMDWVENGQRPNKVVASSRLDNPEITERMMGISRPLCPYPSYAVYQSGSYQKARSFACATDDLSR